MTFIDWMHSLPVWLMWTVVAFLAVWMFEMFLYPFKQNIQRKRIKDLLETQRKFMEQLKKRTDDLEKSNAMCASLMAILLKQEQQKEDARNARKSRDRNGRRESITKTRKEEQHSGD